MTFYGLFHCGLISWFADRLTGLCVKLESCLPRIFGMLNNNSIIIQVVNTLIAFILNFTTGHTKELGHISPLRNGFLCRFIFRLDNFSCAGIRGRCDVSFEIDDVADTEMGDTTKDQHAPFDPKGLPVGLS